METALIDLLPLYPAHDPAVEDLLDRAFGEDRRSRTAYRVREATAPLPELSLVAVEDGAVIGSIQCWPVALMLDGGGSVPLVMVGPIAVAPERQQGGLGRRLTTAALTIAGPDAALMLVGDPEYYARFFGFSSERTGRWRLPGPFDPRRLLARGPVPDAAGMLGPRA